MLLTKSNPPWLGDGGGREGGSVHRLPSFFQSPPRIPGLLYWGQAHLPPAVVGVRDRPGKERRFVCFRARAPRAARRLPAAQLVLWLGLRGNPTRVVVVVVVVLAAAMLLFWVGGDEGRAPFCRGRIQRPSACLLRPPPLKVLFRALLVSWRGDWPAAAPRSFIPVCVSFLAICHPPPGMPYL